MPLINGQIGQIWENCHFICQKVHYFWSYWLNKCKIDINFNILPKNIPIFLKPGLPLLLLKGVSELTLSFSFLDLTFTYHRYRHEKHNSFGNFFFITMSHFQFTEKGVLLKNLGTNKGGKFRK